MLQDFPSILMRWLLPALTALLLFSALASADSYTVTLNTSSGITEAQLRSWLDDVGYEPLTRLVRVDVVDEGLTYASVGGGCYRQTPTPSGTPTATSC